MYLLHLNYLDHSCLFIVPENMSAPVLTTTTDGSIVISWQPPLLPHGVIIRYRVERSMSAPDSFSQVATVSSSTLTYTDTSLTPFSVYRYRIIAENSAGQVTGPFAAIQTPEAGKQVHYTQHQCTEYTSLKEHHTYILSNLSYLLFISLS